MKNDCTIHGPESKLLLKNNGLKITSARLKLLDIFKHAKKPLTIKEIAKQAKNLGADLVTLYRNVENLENLGFVKQILLNDRESYYELSDPNHHHHHLICRVCGKISDVEKCEPPKLSANFLASHGFARIEQHSLEFFGVCKVCSKKIV